MAGARAERVDDLFFEDQTVAGNPAEEGLVRRVSGDLVAFIGGSVKSLTSGVGGSGDDPNSLFNDLNESYDLLITRDAELCPTSVLAHAPGVPGTKIREIDNITFDIDCNINGMRIRQFADDGTTVLETLTFNGTGWVLT